MPESTNSSESSRHQKQQEQVTTKNIVSLDTFYSELRNEMRRYRDQHFSLFQWHTTLSFAIIAAITGVAQLKTIQPLLHQLRLWLSAILIIEAVFACHWGWYTNKRYNQLKNYVIDIEPIRKNDLDLVKSPYKFKPHHSLLILTVLFTVTILGVLWKV